MIVNILDVTELGLQDHFRLNLSFTLCGEHPLGQSGAVAYRVPIPQQTSLRRAVVHPCTRSVATFRSCRCKWRHQDGVHADATGRLR